jgi:magnesium transporter
VLDDSGKLTGMLSMHELFRAKDSDRVGKVCQRTSLLWVNPYKHQERAVYKALKHNIKAVPVVDHDRTFLGTIPSDTLLKVLYKETHEDLLRHAGIERSHPLFDNVITMPLWLSVFHRLPWLLIGLLGGILAAKVVGFFEHTLQQNIVLAAFIPLIVYMSDAVGTQMEAFIIRDLAVDRHLKFGRYVFRQLLVVSSVGLVCSGFLYVACLMFYPGTNLAPVVATALFASVLSSIITGLLIPFIFSRFRADPANASGPIATIIQDILSLLIYFAVATIMLE